MAFPILAAIAALGLGAAGGYAQRRAQLAAQQQERDFGMAEMLARTMAMQGQDPTQHPGFQRFVKEAGFKPDQFAGYGAVAQVFAQSPQGMVQRLQSDILGNILAPQQQPQQVAVGEGGREAVPRTAQAVVPQAPSQGDIAQRVQALVRERPEVAALLPGLSGAATIGLQSQQVGIQREQLGLQQQQLEQQKQQFAQTESRLERQLTAEIAHRKEMAQIARESNAASMRNAEMAHSRALEAGTLALLDNFFAGGMSLEQMATARDFLLGRRKELPKELAEFRSQAGALKQLQTALTGLEKAGDNARATWQKVVGGVTNRKNPLAPETAVSQIDQANREYLDAMNDVIQLAPERSTALAQRALSTIQVLMDDNTVVDAITAKARAAKGEAKIVGPDPDQYVVGAQTLTGAATQEQLQRAIDEKFGLTPKPTPAVPAPAKPAPAAPAEPALVPPRPSAAPEEVEAFQAAREAQRAERRSRLLSNEAKKILGKTASDHDIAEYVRLRLEGVSVPEAVRRIRGQ